MTTLDRKPPKPDMRVKIGEIIGEEGLVAAPIDGEDDAAFVGLQFLCFPSMSVVMGEEAEDAQAATATQELLAAFAETSSSLPTPGRDSSGEGLERADSCGGTGGRAAGQPPPTRRELLNAHAGKAYVRASFDLAIKGLMLADVQKRTQGAVKRFTESLKPAPETRTKGGKAGAGPSSPAPLPPALSPLRRGMAMHLLVDSMEVELVLANPAGAKDEGQQPTEEEGPRVFTAILMEMKDCRMSMFERHRRVPLASLAATPGGRVPSIMEMVMDAGSLTMTAAAGEATGKMLEAVELRACYEKVRLLGVCVWHGF